MMPDDMLAVLTRENAEMKARLRAVYDIVTGGEIPAEVRRAKPSTPGCNCDFDGVLDPAAHQFGCPYGPVMRQSDVARL